MHLMDNKGVSDFAILEVESQRLMPCCCSHQGVKPRGGETGSCGSRVLAALPTSYLSLKCSSCKDGPFPDPHSTA